MRRVPMYGVAVATAAILGITVAFVAAFGDLKWALAIAGLALSAFAVVFALLERRFRVAIRSAQQSADRSRQMASRASGQIDRVERLVEAMQRRVVSSVEAARVEAARRQSSDG